MYNLPKILIALKPHLLEWLNFVSDLSGKEHAEYLEKIAYHIKSEWKGCNFKIINFSISVEFYFPPYYSYPLHSNTILSITYAVNCAHENLSITVREDRSDEAGYHHVPQDEYYTLHASLKDDYLNEIDTKAVFETLTALTKNTLKCCESKMEIVTDIYFNG